jgi:hypothetical protein
MGRCSEYNSESEEVERYAIPIYPQTTASESSQQQSTLPDLRAALRAGRRAGRLVPYAAEPGRHALHADLWRGLCPLVQPDREKAAPPLLPRLRSPHRRIVVLQL